MIWKGPMRLTVEIKEPAIVKSITFGFSNIGSIKLVETGEFKGVLTTNGRVSIYLKFYTEPLETITIEITQAEQEYPLQIDYMAIKGVEQDIQSMSAMKRKNEEKERMRS